MKVSSKKLSKIVGKWKRRGSFVVYSKDNKRFVVPLRYLNHPIFRVLLEMAEEEYGLTADGPLQVPLEKELVEYILCLLRKHPTEEVEKAVLSLASCRGATLQAPNQERMGTPVVSCG
ncbi:UNVERIFIED_CONTAM: Auxin-responsive protein SAUR36 [Sesamum calycinum]|uniref:Auxin-responsive protein SAUR36 n=2 Tax=Sesamum TaxID=4181 RepID=A0AAE1WCL8_9LAMI|nr:Auxin-responsive protein SAUR36 [Sesamum angolense]